MLCRKRTGWAAAAAFGILCPAATFGQTMSTGDVSWPSYFALSYFAMHNGIWFRADSPLGPWMLADYVPPQFYTIPRVCPLVHGGFVCVYPAGDSVGDFYSGWPWTWAFRRELHRLPDAVVIEGTSRANGARAGPRSEPRSEARSEPRSEPRSAAD